MVNFLWNLTFRKILGPFDGVKTKLGVIIVALAGIMHTVLAVVPGLAGSPVWATVIVVGAKVGSVLAGIGLIDKAAKLTDALEGK